MKVYKTNLAKQDIFESASHIARLSSTQAFAFLGAVELSIETIRAAPRIGIKKNIWGVKNLRMWPVKTFNRHLIFYRADKDTITIVRLIHSARNYSSLSSV